MTCARMYGFRVAPLKGSGTLAFLANLRAWIQSEEGRAELSPELLQRIRAELARSWSSHDPDSRRVLILDLDRRELARLLAQMAARAQSRN